MNKLGQKRSLKNKFVENVNKISPFGGAVVKKFFDKDFKRVMDSLISADNDIRSIALGKSVDKGSFGLYDTSLKDLLKSAKSNFARKEYIKLVTDLGLFHEKMAEINVKIQIIDDNVEQIHNEFMFKEVPDDNIERLRKLDERFKTAGIMDYFHNLTSRRGRALMAWEARYPKKTEELKKQSLVILNKSQELFDDLIESLKIMAEARANSNVDDYMKRANVIVNKYKNYDSLFKTYYKEQISPYILRAKLFDKSNEAKEEGFSISEDSPTSKINEGDLDNLRKKMNETQTSNENVSSKPVSEVPSSLPSVGPESSVNPLGKTEPSVRQQVYQDRPGKYDYKYQNRPAPAKPVNQTIDVPFTHVVDPKQLEMGYQKTKPNVAPVSPNSVSEFTPTLNLNVEDASKHKQEWESKPLWERMKEVQIPSFKKSHHEFYNTLESMSNSSPIVLKNYITKYATLIQYNDLETAIELFKLAKKI